MLDKALLKNRVRELRARLNLRQADLADEIGVSRQTILAIEKGRLNPSVMIALKIARVLREPTDYVFHLTSVQDWEKAGEDGASGSSSSSQRSDAKHPSVLDFV